jgi:hypothetical protein
MAEYENLAPYWFVSFATEGFGENALNPLYDSQALFLAKAWILNEPGAELEKYLDVPAFARGDLFYIQKLVAAIENTVVAPSSFTDVPAYHPYAREIEILYANGLTAGCSTNPLMYCPDQIMNRGEAAVFILRGNFGTGFLPGLPVHFFKDDWTKGTWAEPWAEAMYTNGLSAGCSTSPLKYCPWDQIPREQAVIFALRLKYGNSYTPPPATGTLFADMTDVNYYATPWAEQAYKDGLIEACGASGGKPMFCPTTRVTRGLGADMIVRAKNLTMP